MHAGIPTDGSLQPSPLMHTLFLTFAVTRATVPCKKMPLSDPLAGGTRVSKKSQSSEDLIVHSQGTRTIFGSPSAPKASSTTLAASGSALKLNSEAQPLLPLALSHAPITTTCRTLPAKAGSSLICMCVCGGAAGSNIKQADRAGSTRTAHRKCEVREGPESQDFQSPRILLGQFEVRNCTWRRADGNVLSAARQAHAAEAISAVACPLLAGIMAANKRIRSAPIQ